MSLRKRACSNRLFICLLAGIALLVCMALCAPLVSPYDPIAIDLDNIKQPPGYPHIFGTDTLGRDILSRVIYGSCMSLLIGLSATVLSLFLGLCAGLVSGYFGGRVDTALTVIIDLFLAFPSLLLAIAVSVLLPPGLGSTVFALCIAGWASFARLFRGMVLSFKEQIFVEAAHAIGCSHMRIVFVHILPHCIPLALVAASLKAGSFILSEAALSFLGLGVQPPTPTWGSMISLYRSYLPSAPWMVLFPGGAIACTVFLFNIIGDMLRDMLDPRLKV